MYKELHAEYGDRGVQIISISMDDEEDLDAVKAFVSEYEITYTSLMDDGEVSLQYRAMGLPATYLMDQEGRIVKSFVGVKPKRVLVELIDGLLANGSGDAG
jgi:peroxiredoxin